MTLYTIIQNKIEIIVKSSLDKKNFSFWSLENETELKLFVKSNLSKKFNIANDSIDVYYINQGYEFNVICKIHRNKNIECKITLKKQVCDSRDFTIPFNTNQKLTLLRELINKHLIES